jgi:predicted DNA-binding transcriptional regulator AlpA
MLVKVQNSTMRTRLMIAAIEQRTGYNRTTIWRKCRKGEFPSPHYIGERRAWWLDEIEQWEAAEMARPASARRAIQNLRPRGVQS